MIDEILEDAAERMDKSIASLEAAFARIRTGRAHPSFLDSVDVDYYGSDTPLSQMANINVEEGRTLVIAPWDRTMVPLIEKAILKSDLGVTPNQGEARITMPPLTEKIAATCKGREMRRKTHGSRCVISDVMQTRYQRLPEGKGNLRG